jgi:hypothetical protein
MFARLTALGLLLLAQAGLVAEANEKDDPDFKKATELIRKLRDDRFVVRESASKKLLAMGRAAKTALIAGKNDPDPEVADRCRKLLPIILAEDLKVRIDAFVADTEMKKEHTLPGWAEYQKVVGKEKDARELFVQMLQSNPKLFETFEFEPEQFGHKYAIRSGEMMQQGIGRIRGQPLTTGDMGTLFFFGLDPAMSKLLTNQQYLGNLLYQPVFQNQIREARGIPLRTLFFKWMEHRDDPNTVSVALSLVQQFNMKEGLNLAVRSMKDKQQNAYYRAQAMTVLGKVGGKEYVKEFEKLFDDDVSIQPFNLKGKQGAIQVRDVALAMSVHLNGQKTKDYGFEFLDHETNIWSYYYLGFESDDKRNESIKKWKSWLEDQSKKK